MSLSSDHAALADTIPAAEPGRHRLSLLALALGTFCIGTTEFASMGIIQLFSAELGVDIPTATHAITAYAIGVVLGAPALTLLAARFNRRTLLLALICIFILGNVLSAMAGDLNTFITARFVTGLPQGAYFGAGAVVASHLVGAGHAGRAFATVMAGLTVATIVGSPIATFLGQTLGWRETYICIAAIGGFSLLSLWFFIPRTSELNGAPVLHELRALDKPLVWLMLAVAALGISSIFAVYTFIGPFVTDLLLLPPNAIPPALALFGIGMMVGNLYGGRLADQYAHRGIVAGYGVTLVILVAMALFGTSNWVLFAGFFGVGACMMAAIPTIQVRLVGLAPQSPTLMGAMNLAALNVANALGAWAGGFTIGAGYGPLSPLWAGLTLTGGGLALFAIAIVSKGFASSGMRQV